MGRVIADGERAEPIGQTVGNYTILRKLSTGGMGTVYYAEHALIGRAAAVKVLHPELSGSKDIVNRFFNEAKATTSIKHPGIVEIFDYGYLPTGDGYLIMELLEGMSLARRLKNGRRYHEGEAAMLIRGVCSALAAAHAKGIVHRDLKPDNIFLVDDADAPIGERPKVLDFGIAKLTDIGLAGTATKTGAVMGTPTYMSPEQCRGTGQVDHRADLYSIGCILYEIACGRPPFKNLGAGELIGAHQHLQPSPPSKYHPGISAEMEALIVSLLDKDPSNRVQTAHALAQRLAAIAAKHGYHTSMVTPVAGLATASSADEAATSMTEVAITGDPTTLSHGAAESVPSMPVERRSRVSKLAPLLALAAAAAIAVVTVNAMQNAEPVAAPHVAPGAATTSTPPPVTRQVPASEAVGAQPPMPSASEAVGAQPPMPSASEAVGAQPPAVGAQPPAVGAQPPMPAASEAVGAQPPMPSASDALAPTPAPAASSAPAAKPPTRPRAKKSKATRPATVNTTKPADKPAKPANKPADKPRPPGPLETDI